MTAARFGQLIFTVKVKGLIYCNWVSRIVIRHFVLQRKEISLLFISCFVSFERAKTVMVIYSWILPVWSNFPLCAHNALNRPSSSGFSGIFSPIWTNRFLAGSRTVWRGLGSHYAKWLRSFTNILLITDIHQAYLAFWHTPFTFHFTKASSSSWTILRALRYANDTLICFIIISLRCKLPLLNLPVPNCCDAFRYY